MYQLYEYAAIYAPASGDERVDDPKPQIVLAPKALVAASEDEVRMIAAREISVEFADKLEDVEIIVRPFAE